MTRWALERTLALVDDQARAEIERVLSSDPLEKPADHKGGPETDCFLADFDRALARTVLGSLDVGNDSQLRHLSVVWAEYHASRAAGGGTMR